MTREDCILLEKSLLYFAMTFIQIFSFYLDSNCKLILGNLLPNKTYISLSWRFHILSLSPHFTIYPIVQQFGKVNLQGPNQHSLLYNLSIQTVVEVIQLFTTCGFNMETQIKCMFFHKGTDLSYSSESAKVSTRLPCLAHRLFLPKCGFLSH